MLVLKEYRNVVIHSAKKYCYKPQYNYLATSRITLTVGTIAAALMATVCYINLRHHSNADVLLCINQSWV